MSVKGQLTFNTSHAMMEPVLSGLGVGFVPNSIADPYVETGELEIVLDDWSPFFDGYFLYYPTSRQHLPIFKTILDALRH